MTDKEILARIRSELVAAKKAQNNADKAIPLSFGHDIWLKQVIEHRNLVTAWIDKYYSNKKG